MSLYRLKGGIPMRVFMISRGYPTEKYITNGIFEYDQAKALAKRGHEVIFIVLDLRSLKKKRQMGMVALERDGVHIEIINFPVSDFCMPLTRTVRKKAIRKIYRKCVEKYGAPDVIHAHFLEIAHSAAQALRDEGVPMVMTEHMSKLINQEFTPSIKKIGNKTYPFYDHVIAVSSALSKTLHEVFGVDAEVIPNIVDLKAFPYPENRPARTSQTFNVISVGHLKKVKRMDDLIRAFGMFCERRQDAVLRIFGMGTEYAGLQKLIDDLKLNDCVRLEGMARREEIAEAMKSADCFALFSVSETFGVAFIEAISMGLPVIATRCLGPEDFIDESNGIMVDSGDLDGMVQAFEDMYLHRDRYDGRQISRSINERFSPDVIARQIENAYRKLLLKKD